MPDSATLDTMACEELLAELARLTASKDRLNASVATPEQADPHQEPHVDTMLDVSAQIDRIGELLRAKGCA